MEGKLGSGMLCPRLHTRLCVPGLSYGISRRRGWRTSWRAVKLSSVGWPTIGWNDGVAVAKDMVISSGIIIATGVMKSRRYEEEHEW